MMFYKLWSCGPWAFILVIILLTGRMAFADEPEKTDGCGAAASDPTAGVNYLDIKPRYFDLTEGNEESVLEVEGVYAFSLPLSRCNTKSSAPAPIEPATGRLAFRNSVKAALSPSDQSIRHKSEVRAWG